MKNKLVWVLGIILALVPTYLIRLQLFGFPTTVLELLLVVFLFLTLLTIRAEDLRKIKSLGQINLAVGLFALAGIISTFISPDRIHALGQLKAFIFEPILLFYASVLILKTEEEKKLVLKWLFAAASLISLFGIFQYFTYFHLPIRFWGSGSEVERIASVFDYPNALALYLAPLFAFFASLWISKYSLTRKAWHFSAGLILILVAITLTFSRGAWFALVVSFGILLLTKFPWKKVLLPGLVCVLILLAISPIRQRVWLGLSDPSSSAHVDLMKVGVQKILSSPFLGNGLAGFPQTLRDAKFPGEILNYPHNIFLNFWLEMGLLGLIGFALIIFFASQQHKKHPTLLGWAAGMFLLTMILHGFVDVPYFKNDLSVLFWFMISLFYV